MKYKVKSIGRDCAGCTKCCEGWLSGQAYGHTFNIDKRCIFLRGGCSIYPNHPIDPCKLFECQWKMNRSLPEWLKPDKVGAIILKKQIDIFEYLMIVPAGKKIDKCVFDWAERYSQETIKNHVVIFNGKNFNIYSKHRHFKEIANKKWNKGG
jgi:hypothetical protein